MQVFKLKYNIGPVKAGDTALLLFEKPVPTYFFDNGTTLAWSEQEKIFYLDDCGEVEGEYKYDDQIKLIKDLKQGYFEEIFEKAKALKPKTDD